MTLTDVYQAVLTCIEDQYPAAVYPAEAAYFAERYRYNSEGGIASEMSAAVSRCLELMEKVARQRPDVPEEEAFELALSKYLMLFTFRLADEAEAIFEGQEVS